MRIILAVALGALVSRPALAQCPDGTPPPCGVERSAAPVGNPRQSLIVFPFDNRTGDASRDYLGEAAMNLLGLAVAQWQDMRVYDDERTASLMRRRGISSGRDLDFEDARTMARTVGVGTLVLGDIRREADSLAIEAKVHDVRTGRRLETIIRRQSLQADPRPTFDALAAQLLGISGAPSADRPSLIAQTTTSIEAYRAFLAGSAALQRFQIDSARLLLNRAIALDSNFAIAYLRLYDAYGWSARNDGGERQRMSLRAAERRSTSLPPRPRALVAYHRAYDDQDYGRARRIAESLIARDSTDVEAWYILGEAHYHDRSNSWPRADSLGDIGRARDAFARSLALDSGYVLAYQHLTDVYQVCANWTFLACLRDSAAYAEPAVLAQRLGADALQRLRAAQRDSVTLIARAWVAAVPSSPRALVVLLQALFDTGRYQQVVDEADIQRQASITAAATLGPLARYMLGDVPGAVNALRAVLRNADTSAVVALGPGPSAAVLLLAGGGRVADARRITQALFRPLARDSVFGIGGVRVIGSDGAATHNWAIANEAGQGVPPLADYEALLNRVARGNDARRRALTQSFGSMLVASYFASRDTALLSALVTRADTANSSTWRVADGLLALARGDSARARLRVTRHYEQPVESEFLGEQGMVRTFAWAELLARLGRPRDAITAYARLDTTAVRFAHPGLVVRSWAERAALYRQLGEQAEAARWYQRFVAAWQQADPPLQPVVQRARAALAELPAN